MQFNLTPEDVVTALKAHIAQQMDISLSNKTVAFTFKNKRNKGGVIAGVTISTNVPDPSVPAILQAAVPTQPEAVTEALEPVVEPQQAPLVTEPEPVAEEPAPTTQPIIAPSLFD